MTVRPATPADAAPIARIYNEGIADRAATFETRLRDRPRLVGQAIGFCGLLG
jgi:L-amino acid N-acyltransferase YncA